MMPLHGYLALALIVVLLGWALGAHRSVMRAHKRACEAAGTLREFAGIITDINRLEAQLRFPPSAPPDQVLRLLLRIRDMGERYEK